MYRSRALWSTLSGTGCKRPPASLWRLLEHPDQHLHVLMHVPQRHWQPFEVTVVGWHLGPDEVDVTRAHQRTLISDNGKRRSAVGYILKQMSPQACWKRGLSRRKGGPILGKRGGVSRIDRRAQGSDQGRRPPARDRSAGGWPRGGARPRGVRESWKIRGGSLAPFQKLLTASNRL